MRFAADKYLNFFSNDETVAGVTTIQEYDYDTGITPRGGWLWEIHTIEVMMQPDPAAATAGVIEFQAVALSMLSGEATQPTIGDFGCLYRRQLYHVGNSTSNAQYWCEPQDRILKFARPFLYAKNKIYAYYQQSGTATGDFRFRIGYTTKKVTGQMMIEVMEQHLSSAT